jgi:diadenosine tetraphosphate (Ap4A) HIT family hydrolase
MSEFQLHPQLANDCIEVLDWPLCKLLLMNNDQVPWLILVPRVDGVEELHELDSKQQFQLLQEIELASSYLQYVYKPHKLNVAAIGNKVRQLHVHVVARQEGDACWPEPVWGNLQPQPYADDELDSLVKQLRAALQ